MGHLVRRSYRRGYLFTDKENFKKDKIMKNITEESGIQKEWYKQAKTQTTETIFQFVNHLMNDFGHDYGTICHALAAGAIGTATAMNKHKNGGITGFQAGAVMWEFVKNWNYEHNKTGLKIVDFDNMLFPQYADKFDKKISVSIFEALQKQAIECLAKEGKVHPSVKAHWQSIAEGNIPFGYSISAD